MENSLEITKKLKNTITDSFQAKIGWKMMRKRENKNYRSVPFRSQCLIENSKKITKKFKKLRNTIMNSFLAKIGWKRMRKRGIKIIVPFCSYPKRNRKFRKNNKKN